MKRFVRFALAAVLACAGLVATAPAAHAGNIVLRAAGSQDPASAAATRVVSSGTNHRYVTVDYATGAESCTLFHFGVFSDYTNGADISPLVVGTTSGTSTNNVQLRMDFGCGTPSIDNYDTLSLTAGTAFNITPSGTANVLVTNTPGSSNINETTPGCTAGDAMVLRVCRVNNDGGTANPNTFKLVQIRLAY